MKQFLVFPYPEEAGLAPSWPAGVARDGKMKKRPQTEATGSILTRGREGKMEILDQTAASGRAEGTIRTSLGLAAALALFAGSFCCPCALSQTPLPALAWQKQFPEAIDWFVKTSSGVLLVRAGKILYAIDAKDGRQLWSMQGLDISGERGRNLLEIPGSPTLLVKRGTETAGTLLAVDLWTGTSASLDTGIENFFALVPIYEKERYVLVTGPGLPFTPRLQLRPMFEHGPSRVEWKTKYPHTVSPLNAPEVVVFYAFDGDLYFHSQRVSDFHFGRVDLRTGQRIWKFGRFNLLPRIPLWADGKVLIPGKMVFPEADLVLLDAESGKPVWKAKKLGTISGLVRKENTILASGTKGVFALDISSGATRWHVTTKERATAAHFFEQGNALVFCDGSDLIMVDTGSGKILRRSALKLQRAPTSCWNVGTRFLLAHVGEEVALYDIPAERVIWAERAPDVALEPTEFLVSHPRPQIKERSGYLRLLFLGDAPHAHKHFPGGALVWEAALERSLSAYWPRLEERAGQNESWRILLQRLKASLMNARPVYATNLAKNEWKLWRIDPSTGQHHEWVIPGEQPDFIGAFDLACSFARDTLRAYRLE